MRSVIGRRRPRSPKSMVVRRSTMPRSVLGPAVWYPPAANRRADSVALRWTQSAYGDLRRLYEFLEPVNPGAAVRAVRLIVNRIQRIAAPPRLRAQPPRRRPPRRL